jgi:NAD(P)-dependent dehydrogenase (short-subunit alcohol dehydrogenase family)
VNTPRPWDRGGDAGRRLDGRVAVVTGAGSSGDLMGIGGAIATLFAAQGAKVGIVDISRDRAAHTHALVGEFGGESMVAVGDVTDIDDNARCVDEVVDRFGRLDIVVNSAAVTRGSGSPVDVDLKEWDDAIALNLTAVVLTARHTIPHLRAVGGGSMVNISSIAATRGMGSGAYAASKAAMIGLTKDWAYQHGREGVRVNCLVIGHVFTPMGNQGDTDVRERRRLVGLLGTEGTAWDVAWPAVFLASEEARWITGVAIAVDAGTTATTALGIQVLNERSAIAY